MKVACVGGGPAGLYFSILMKRRDPAHDVTVYERNPAGSTYGWGVTYWGELLEKLARHDPASAQAVRAASVSWNSGVAHIHGATTVQHGDQGFGIGRQRLLDLLAGRAEELGVHLAYEQQVADAAQVGDADLVVAADGVHSRLRQGHAEHFGSRTVTGRNPYIWLGTTKVFPSFTFAFVDTPHGWVWCYAYPYSDEHSTFLVECSPATWAGLGLDRAGEAEGLTVLEKLFAQPLEGHPLIGRSGQGGRDQAEGGAPWLRFGTLTNDTWHRGNLVLAGDAAHTTHYSTGAGTTLALEDAISLCDHVHAAPRLPDALAAYQRERTAALRTPQSNAHYSARWYESLPRYTALPPAHMFTLLGQRHSPLLPLVPAGLYYRLNETVERMESLRRFKRWLGPRLSHALHGRG